MGFQLAELLEGQLIDELKEFVGEGVGGLRRFCGGGGLFRGPTQKLFGGDAEIVGDFDKGGLSWYGFVTPTRKGCVG